MGTVKSVTKIKNIQNAFRVLLGLQLTGYMWPQQSRVKDGARFDFIIVGAGSAGCTIANRLTEIEYVNVLLIEAGGDPPIESVLPSLQQYLQNSRHDWNGTSKDDGYTAQCHKNKVVEITRGKMLGGSSSINNMIYTRGNPQDYLRWAEISNDSSWNWDNVFKYFVKSERLVDPIILNSPEKVYHGTSGNLGVMKFQHEAAKEYLAAFQELGNNIVADTEGNSFLGVSEPLFTIADGVRQSTAYAYLTPIKERPNLHVLKNSLATKIIFDGYKTAIGVEVLTKCNKSIIIKANKEIIISAGAINSPQLLMLSGIGPEQHLRSKNIKIIADLPVGQNYQNHIGVFLIYKMKNIVRKPAPTDPRKPPYPTIIGFIAINKTQSYPDYEIESHILDDPYTSLSECDFFQKFTNNICSIQRKFTQGRKVFLVYLKLIHEKSRGRILLRSSNPTDSPIVITGYYSKDIDLQNHIKYVKDFLPIVNTTYFRSVDAELVDPVAEKCGKHKFGSTKYWRCYILCMMTAQQHYCGTCAMGSVVDSRLRVIGIKRLRVADASIMPTITSAHTNVPTIMIGEKVADMLKEDHQLK